MLNKNQLTNLLSTQDNILKHEIYDYICKFNLYEDPQINQELIKFIENNYSHINFSSLIQSKLNTQIIECLIKIFNKPEATDRTKSSIISVLVNHYKLIKDLNYNVEEIFSFESDEELKLEYNKLLYKKIKHFSKKDPKQLMQLYIPKIEQYSELLEKKAKMEEKQDWQTLEEITVQEIITKAMGIALVQSEEGEEVLKKYYDELIDEAKMNDEKKEELIYDIMPCIVYPLCITQDLHYYITILNFYFNNIDFLENYEECNYYFSNICCDEFINKYIELIHAVKKHKTLENYHYDIAEFLNSEIVDEFLLSELKNCKDKELKKDIICILARKFNKKIIPYALELAERDNLIEDDIFGISLYPLLIMENCSDEVSKSIINQVRQYYLSDFSEDEAVDIKEIELSEMASRFLNGMQDLLLKDKPHIKQYKKIRKLHDEIMKNMMNYWQSGKYQIKIEAQNTDIDIKQIDLLYSEFDCRTILGVQALSNILVYKNSDYINCITEEYLEKNRFRNEDKKEMLNCMLNSEAGLFEIISTDEAEGKIYLKDVLNEKEYCITDIGLSSNIDNSKFYIYTRIINFDNISFSTGLHIVFHKNDKFIEKWIDDNKKNYNSRQEFVRFVELYNEYIKDDKGIIMHATNM